MVLQQVDCGVARLRAWRPDDLDSLVANASHADVARGLRDRFPYPYTGDDDGRAWLARAVDESDRAWAIEMDGLAVGGVSLHPGSDVHRHSAELGYWIGRRFWARGIMSKVVARFAPEAMVAFRLHRLFAAVYANNPSSARVLEKAGFAREGVQKSAVVKRGELLSAVVKRGELLDLIVYARVRDSLESSS